jgi:hypothetical protein|tara:strand:+ start:385 stop:720 length:336 start_codon:yes stop_codon:yes gene_type:complete
MKIPVKEIKTVSDGQHTGKIVAVESRTEPYQYTDYVIEFTEKDSTYKLKAGYPTNLCAGSKHAIFLAQFGMELVVGTNVDPEKFCIGKEVSFLTMTKNNFANIVPESVKPK